MTPLLSRRRLIGAIVLATSLGSGAALSQTGSRVADPLPARDVELAGPGVADGGVRPRVIKIPCCVCAGTTTAITTLSSGSVPWSASGPTGSGMAVASANPAWTTMLSPAHWISPPGNPTAPGTYTYSIHIQLPNCALNGPVEIDGSFLADNTGTLVVDGKTIKSSQGTPNYGFLPGSLTPFSFSLSGSGVHTISLQAVNSDGPTGAVISMVAKRKCPGDPKAGELPNG